MLDNFHFIRPDWFYALLPSVILFIWLFRQQKTTISWQNICDKELLDHFLIEKGSKRSRYPIILLFVTWMITIFALAGPSWKKIKLPVFSKNNAMVIIFDLSLSMNAQDLKPTRLIRARHKLEDILKQRDEGQAALIVYAGDAHIVSPLTDDNKTILSFVSVLDTNLMPIPGSNLSSALIQAERLFENAGLNKGQIIVFTDGLTEDEHNRIQQINRDSEPKADSKENRVESIITRLKNKNIVLSILGIGTSAGAPIPLSEKDGGFVKNAQGNIVVSRLNSESLDYLANQSGGIYQTITLDDKDIKKIKQRNFIFNQQLKKAFTNQKQEQLNSEQWLDYGAWFSLLLIPFMLFAFRRGWFLSLFFVICLPIPEPVYSMQWNDLWLRADQQAIQSFKQGQHQQAAEKFQNSSWKGAAYYKARDYQQAVSHLKDSKHLDDQYNLANSYAQLKQFDEAIKTYDQVLKQNPEHAEALRNKKIIENLLKQQKQQQQNQKQQSNNSDNKENNQEGNQKGESQDSQNSENKDGSKSAQPGEQQKQTENADPQNDNNDNNQKQQKEQTTEEKKQALKDLQDKKAKEDKEKTQQAKLDKSKDENTQGSGEKQDKDTLFSQLDEEQQQSMQQYLNQIKDDPAYLLRRKFYLNSARSKQGDINSIQQPMGYTPLTNPQGQQSW
ncbi:MAG: VWA domain-containing protein [Gammaproteobacteria bacterium]|nr:VWA domain-containing protein [Gammaproteobacteria bacterium]